MGILCAFLGAVCVYLLQVFAYRKFWDRNLSVSAAFVQRAVVEKEEGELRETIINRKWLPLPMLRVKFETDRHLDFLQEGNVAVTDRCYKCDIFSVMAYQKITRTLKFRGLRRGFYVIGGLQLDSTDLFMQEHLDRSAPCQTRIYVYPAQADVKRLLIPFQKMMGDILTRRYTYEDPFEFQGIRPYQPFDNMRDVNWKASARSGELRTNVHGFTVRQEICLLLNLETEAILEYKDLKEESIRIAGSLTEMFLAQGIPVGLYSNAKDLLTEKELRLSPGAGEKHLTTVRESLARLNLDLPMQEFGTLLETYGFRNAGDTLYVLISCSQRECLRSSFGRFCADHAGSMWILPLHPQMEQKAQTTKEFTVMRWEVEQNAS